MTKLLHATSCFQETAIKLKLSHYDMYFFHWLKSFMSSGYMQTITDDENNIYYWVLYSKIQSDLPFIFINERAVARAIKRLATYTNDLTKPLIQKLVKTQTGTKVYIRFNQIIMDELEGTNMTVPSSLVTGKAPIAIKSEKDKAYKKMPVNKHVEELFTFATSLEINDAKIFSHQGPIDPHHYSNLFATFQKTMQSLYDGNFMFTHKIADLKEWFTQKYNYYLKNSEIKTHINSCKGDWDAIVLLMRRVFLNYKMWFDNTSELQNKDTLPRNINDFMFNVFNGTSMFYVCLVEGPTSLREAQAEKIYNNIHPKYRKIMESLYDERWDGFNYWNKIRALVKWYKLYADDLMADDTNITYWLGAGIEAFLKNYKEWLLQLTDGELFLNHIGIGTKTWDLYVSTKIKDHNITAKIPRTL